MDVREKLIDILKQAPFEGKVLDEWWFEEKIAKIADYLVSHSVTVQEWINSDEMLPEFPCLAIDVNGNSVFIPDGILTIKDKHGEWCINASLAKEVRLIDGTKMDALIWENRIAYWMPIPQPPKGE